MIEVIFRPPTPPEVSPGLTGSEGTIANRQAVALLPGYKNELQDLGRLPVYDIDLEIDYGGARYSGEMTLDYTNNESVTLQRLFFRLYPNGGKSYGAGSLKVLEINAGGRIAARHASLNDSVLVLDLNEPLDPGERLSMDFVFQGRVPRDFAGGGYGIFGLNRDVMALANAYPMLAVFDEEGWNLDPVSGIGDSVYSDSAYYSVEISTPGGLTLITSGMETHRQLEENGWQTLKFISGPVRDFFVILSPNYKVMKRNIQGTTLRAYYLSGHESGAEYALEVASSSLDIFNKQYGVYPYREFDVVETPLRYASGVEYPGVILLKSSLYENSSSRRSLTVVTTHEVAHQWWYGMVGNDVIDEPWLDEALATYSSAVYFDVKKGNDEYQQLINYYQRNFQQARGNGLDDLVTEDLAHFESTSAGRRSYSPIVYSKGALFYDDLRGVIGDQAFYKALQLYFHENRFRIGEPQELLSAFEQTSSRDLDSMYKEWLYEKE